MSDLITLPMPYQLLAMRRLTALLEKVVGYDIEGNSVPMKGRVFRGRSVFGEETPIPMISLIESNVPADWSEADHPRNLVGLADWSLIIQGFVELDQDNPLDLAYILKAAVEQQLSRVTKQVPSPGRPEQPAFKEDYMLGKRPDGRNLLTGMTIGPGVVRPPDEKLSSTAFFYLPLRVVIATDLSQPFADGPITP